MDNFDKYEALKNTGASADDIYETGKADGLDEITSIRMLRRIFDFSLADAKRTAVGDNWSKVKIPKVQVGSKVHWDGWDGPDGFYFMEGRVASIDGPEAVVEDLKKYKWVDGDFVECSYDGPTIRRLKVAYLERPMLDRLQEAVALMTDLSTIDER